MVFAASPWAITLFWLLLGAGIGVAFRRAPQARDPQEKPAAGPWLLRGLVLGGQGLTGAMLLGVCGLSAFYGYDGLLFAVGFAAGWFAALLIVAPPVARLGKSLGETLQARFPSPGVRRAAAVATLVVCVVLLSAEVIAAGTLLRPMLGATLSNTIRNPTVIIGAIALLLALLIGTAGNRPGRSLGAGARGLLLLLLCGGLAYGLLQRGLTATKPGTPPAPPILSTAEFRARLAPEDTILDNTGLWADRNFARVQHKDGSLTLWHFVHMQRLNLEWPAARFTQCQVITVTPDGRQLLNNKPLAPDHTLLPGGFIARLPMDASALQPAGPLSYLGSVQESNLGVPWVETVVDAAGTHTIYYPVIVYGGAFLAPGRMPGLFPSLSTGGLWDRLNFISLMLALLCGGALIPALYARGIPSGPSAGKVAAVGVGVVGMVFLCALFLGLGALTNGLLDPGDSNATLVSVAAAFGNFTLVLLCTLGLALLVGTMRDLYSAATTALRQGLLPSASQPATSAAITLATLVLATLLQDLNAALIVGAACHIAASAFVPALVFLLFSKATPARDAGIAASILVGLVTSTLWLTADVALLSPLAFTQPALVTIPLALLAFLAGRSFAKSHT